MSQLEGYLSFYKEWHDADVETLPYILEGKEKETFSLSLHLKRNIALKQIFYATLGYVTPSQGTGGKSSTVLSKRNQRAQESRITRNTILC